MLITQFQFASLIRFQFAGYAAMLITFFVFILLNAAACLCLAIGWDGLPLIHTGLIWFCIVIVSLQSTDRFYAADFEDGTLELCFITGLFASCLRMKLVSYWLFHMIGLFFCIPILQIFYNVSFSSIHYSMFGVGSLLFLCIGAIHSALLLGFKQTSINTSVCSILTLPSLFPALILCTSNSTDLSAFFCTMGYCILLCFVFAPFTRIIYKTCLRR
jgi:heme exporter protein CcmB